MPRETQIVSAKPRETATDQIALGANTAWKMVGDEGTTDSPPKAQLHLDDVVKRKLGKTMRTIEDTQSQAIGQAIDPDTWVDEHGDALFRYALFRIQDAQAAEDLVQETFLAALRGKDSFAGRSSVKTWLFGILKHKIIDHFRKISRERPQEDVETVANLTEKDFDEPGGWKYRPAQWTTDPSLLFQQQEFWGILQECMLELPPRLNQVFTLRELDGLSTGDVSKILNVTETNAGVMFHRARMMLRRRLELRWSQGEMAA